MIDAGELERRVSDVCRVGRPTRVELRPMDHAEVLRTAKREDTHLTQGHWWFLGLRLVPVTAARASQIAYAPKGGGPERFLELTPAQ